MLNDLKLMLGIDANDTGRDDLLNLLISTAKARLTLLLGGLEPPASMNHIVREVSIIRFNKIGSEGMGSHTVEGESLAFNEDDFASFADEIQAYLEKQTETTRGRVRFL
jgi:hypothetical protein